MQLKSFSQISKMGRTIAQLEGTISNPGCCLSGGICMVVSSKVTVGVIMSESGPVMDQLPVQGVPCLASCYMTAKTDSSRPK